MSLKWLFLTAKKVNLILPGYFSNANLFENLWLRWSYFWEMGREAANHHLSHQFVIRQSMVLKKKILWTAEAVTWMSSVKKCSSKFSSIHKEIPALESFLNTVTGLQPATLSEKKLRYRCFHESFAKFLWHSFEVNLQTTTSGRVPDFTNNGASSFYYECF